ncbi:MAG: hypothetical protein HXY23_01110 [Parvularculaceae bacterium]|nr:hypothetical protein [Parvularculaceae bacterium]
MTNMHTPPDPVASAAHSRLARLLCAELLLCEALEDRALRLAALPATHPDSPGLVREADTLIQSLTRLARLVGADRDKAASAARPATARPTTTPDLSAEQPLQQPARTPATPVPRSEADAEAAIAAAAADDHASERADHRIVGAERAVPPRAVAGPPVHSRKGGGRPTPALRRAALLNGAFPLQQPLCEAGDRRAGAAGETAPRAEACG